MGELDGKVAIVTGAAHGLGRIHALNLAAMGARVVVSDLGTKTDGSGRDEAPAHAVVEEIRRRGGEAVGHFGDAADWNRRPRARRDGGRALRRPARARQQRGLHARRHHLQHERAGLRLGGARAPEGPLLPHEVRLHPLARALQGGRRARLRPRDRHRLRVGALLRAGPAELRTGQGGGASRSRWAWRSSCSSTASRPTWSCRARARA